ncbi:type IV pilin protein [Rhodanobacter sp. C03]|uniref:type IV pilin protein n=1 Tax=Rhodanobacter sp. C03 TaxID=1945858 RepID=UPI000985B608|nr:type IV pilin protein [Rhodanobacter sp. C03]OOG57263.1 hypothetical protein B0E48_07315 [Rhodanobacter sp. C03]
MARTYGFTLLELMIVVVIIAILATIAIPAYGRYAHRTRRVDAQELLLRIANAQERFYATNNEYGALTDIGYPDPAPSEKGYYLVTSVISADSAGSSAQAFTAVATPVGGQVMDDCNNLSITNTGAKSSSGTTNNGSCW